MIVKHVYFRLQEGACVEEIKRAAEDLLVPIPYVKGIKFYKAVDPDGPGRVAEYPYFLEVTLESMDVHQAYLQHERHVAFADNHLKPFLIGGLEREFFEVVE